MNLIERPTRESIVSSFRTWQYTLIPELLTIGVNYLIQLGLPYDPKIWNPDGSTIKFVPDAVYSRIRHYSCTKIRIDTLDNVPYPLVDFSMPNLIEGTFFKLNSVYYVPMFYISDEPVVLKEQSIVLQSLFQPITLYFGQKRAIFMGSNYKLEDFLQVISYGWDQSDIDLITGELKLSLSSKSLADNLIYFGEKLNCDPTVEGVKSKINQLFFDSWTSSLYHQFYNINPNIDEVFKIAIRRKTQGKKPSFIDLRYKRLTFIEHILKPFFKNVTEASKMLVRNQLIKSLKVPLNGIISHFFSELKGNVLYDTTNGFSGILAHKASFKNPYGTSDLPREVTTIHWTHRNRICPNSISNKNPGETIFLVPDQDLDLRYGIFGFTQDEKERD